MVIKYTDEGWHVITQRAHGILAAKLAAEWKIMNRPERWLETLMAIAEHDDAETETDGETLITPDGGPLNYSMKKFDAAHCSKLSGLSITKLSYIALLTSMHMEFLYTGECKKNKASAMFIKSQRKFQTELRKHLSLSKKKSENAYALLQWCDALSLLICQENFPPENRYAEVSEGPHKVMYSARKKENKINIKPWPFESRSFIVNYEYRIIDQLQFKSSEEFKTSFLKATPRWAQCNISNINE